MTLFGSNAGVHFALMAEYEIGKDESSLAVGTKINTMIIMYVR